MNYSRQKRNRRNYFSGYSICFKYDESFFEKENTGIITQLVLGRYENGL